MSNSGQASAFSLCEALAVLVLLPIEGAQTSGSRGVARGLGRALFTLPVNLGAAIFSLPAYTLKGLEREIHKRRLYKLEADLLIIRIQQLLAEWPELTDEDKSGIITAWDALIAA